MRLKSALLPLLLLALTANVAADPVCPCIPTSYEWVVTPCETWRCAVSEMVVAGGDPFVISMPTNASKFPWVVVRRVVAGAVVVPDDAPFLVEKFDAVGPASSRFTSVEPSKVPLMMTTPDGTSLLVYLRNPDTKRRAVGR